MDETITSFANPTVKRIRALADRKRRRREGRFVVEGLQPVWRAVTSGWRIDTLVVAPELLTNADARAMVDEQGRGGVRVLPVSAEVFRHLSTRDGPAGLAAIVEGGLGELATFVPRDDAAPVIALHRAGNPGNIGTVVRTADAAGAGGLVLLGETADPFAPAAVKSSMGSIFALPVARAAGIDELLDWARDRRRPTVAVTGHAADSLWAADLAANCVLLLGSEGDGLPDRAAARCDRAVSIPMRGTAESLNLATAASVVLYEIARRTWGIASPSIAHAAPGRPAAGSEPR